MIEVVLCTYNGEQYIEEQLLSIIKQKKKVDLISIYDDASTDLTISIIKKIQKKYKNECRINISINSSNLGYVKNFTQALMSVNFKSNFILLSDQDDIWVDNKVEYIIDVIGNTDIPILAFSDAILIDGKGNKLGGKMWNSIKFYNSNIKKELINRNVVTGATVCINGALLNKFKMLKKSVELPHDYYLAIIAAMHGEIKPIRKCLIYYRLHENNQIGSSISIYDKFRKILKNNNKRFSLKKELQRTNDLLNIVLDINSDYYIKFNKDKDMYKEVIENKLFILPFILYKYKIGFFRSFKIIYMKLIR